MKTYLRYILLALVSYLMFLTGKSALVAHLSLIYTKYDFVTAWFQPTSSIEFYNYFFKMQFDSGVFYIAILLIILFIFLNRQRVETINKFIKTKQDIGMVVFLVLYTFVFLVVFLYLYYYTLDYTNFFNTHFIFVFSFLLLPVNFIITIIIVYLLWVDIKFSSNQKLMLTLLIGIFSYWTCRYSLIMITEFSQNLIDDPVFFQPILDFILNSYFKFAWCNPIQPDPCAELYSIMDKECHLMRDINNIPSLRGGHFGIRTILNVTILGTKLYTTNECREARTKFQKCYDFFYSTNKKEK